MIWIDLENKRPTDIDIPNWVPWTQQEWDAWLEKSEKLIAALTALDAANQQNERNELIDANSAHWGALKEWMLALSAGKCWFSEVRELYSHYDVEHFRPKKEAKALDGINRPISFRAHPSVYYSAYKVSGNRKKLFTSSIFCWIDSMTERMMVSISSLLLIGCLPISALA